MNSGQGEATLDVFEACREVTGAWNQRSLVARNSKRKTGAVKTLEKEVSNAYQESKERLGMLFREAETIGCDRQTLTQILIDNLPTPVLRDLMSELE